MLHGMKLFSFVYCISELIKQIIFTEKVKKKNSTPHLNARRLEAFESTSVHSVPFSLYYVIVTGIS